MKDSRDICLIGVDGGGTSCRVALLCGQLRCEVTLGRANATTDRLAAIATVQSGIDQVISGAGINAETLASSYAHVALAGVLLDEDAQEVAAGLRLARVTVSDDRVSTVAGALGAHTGVVAGIGTGSFLARQSGGKIQFIGGWGLALGDEASGAWLGKGLLTATLHSVDGLGQSSEMTVECLRRFGNAAKIVAFANTAEPGDIAELAPCVVAAAKNGDVVGEMLMQRGADYIANGVKQLGWASGETVCLTGGVAAAYTPWLPRDLVANIRSARGSALDGALQLAADAADKAIAQEHFA